MVFLGRCETLMSSTHFFSGRAAKGLLLLVLLKGQICRPCQEKLETFIVCIFFEGCSNFKTYSFLVFFLIFAVNPIFLLPEHHRLFLTSRSYFWLIFSTKINEIGMSTKLQLTSIGLNTTNLWNELPLNVPISAYFILLQNSHCRSDNKLFRKWLLSALYC